MTGPITAAIVAEIRRQIADKPQLDGWIDDELGPELITLDGTFDFTAIETAVREGLAQHDAERCKRCGLERRTNCNCDAGFVLEGVHHGLAPDAAAQLDSWIEQERGRDDPDLGRESTIRPGFFEGDAP